MRHLSIFAVCSPGLEPALASELSTLTDGGPWQPCDGGVEFPGDMEMLWRANLHLHTATRVLVRAGSIRARDFATLFREAAGLPWHHYATVPVQLRLSVTMHRSRLYHSGAVAERVRAAIAKRIVVTSSPSAPLLHVLVRGHEDGIVFSVDSSGEPLYRRGYRLETAKAPLRETLAAGVLILAGWEPATPLWDPMCGSGTLVLEAALQSLARAPGACRDFAFCSWPSFNRSRFSTLVANAAQANRTSPAAPLLGSDRNPSAVAIASRNAERLGVHEHVRFSCEDLAHARLPDQPTGLIVCNAPYGRRIGGSDIRTTYRSLGVLASKLPGWRLAVLTSEPRLLGTVGRDELRVHNLVNGGIRVGLHLYGGGGEGSQPPFERATSQRSIR
ncbi:MAG: hypothetical protein V2A73_08550 [Pseudomonadota bacterium]